MEAIAIGMGVLVLAVILVGVGGFICDAICAAAEDRYMSQNPGAMDGEDLIRFDEENGK